MASPSEPIVAVCYGRVSTDEQASSGLGLAAQRQKVESYCLLYDLLPTAWIADEGVSGSVAPDARPGMAEALEMLAAGAASALVVASVSRLGRRTRDVLDIADRASQQGWRLVILDMGLDTGTSVGEFTLTVLAGVAALERAQTAERTRDALAALKAKGKRLGRPAAESVRAAGRRVIELRTAGTRWADVVEMLSTEGHSTAKGGPWSLTQARRAMETVRLDDEAAAALALSS